MANIAGSYDPNAEASDFSPIPNGNYRALIIEADIEDISKKSNRGRCLKLTWRIETGAYDGRLIWQRINMWPENMENMDKVVQIANSQFAGVRHATGKVAVQDTAELLNIPCEIYVGLSKAQEGYNQQNEVKSVKAIGSGQAAPAAPAAGQQQRFTPPASNPAPAANAGGGSAPWRKSA